MAGATAADIRNPPGARAEPDFDPTHCPYDRFMDRGNETLLKIGFAHIANNSQKSAGLEPPGGPRGLPPHFIRKYCVEQVFIKDFGEVNFDHALTALDYIRDLEFTRRDTLRETAENFGINERNWRNVLGGNPNALAWVEQTQGNELRIETLYSNLFIDLRIWVGFCYREESLMTVLTYADHDKHSALEAFLQARGFGCAQHIIPSCYSRAAEQQDQPKGTVSTTCNLLQIHP